MSVYHRDRSAFPGLLTWPPGLPGLPGLSGLLWLPLFVRSVFLLRLRFPLLLSLLLSLCAPLTFAEPTTEQFASALVEIKATINPQGRTVDTLGASRTGSGVVIDAQGLIVTVSYLVLEAQEVTVSFYDGQQATAAVVAVDAFSGLALLRVPLAELKAVVTPMPLRFGQTGGVAAGDNVIALPAGGLDMAARVRIDHIREFSAPWEYLLESAIFTTPLIRNFSGAALINRDAELVGIGSLGLDSVSESNAEGPQGNLFIPVDLLTSRLGVLLASKPVTRDARAWLGLMVDAQLSVSRVMPDSPAEQAGVRSGDVVVAVNSNHVIARGQFLQTLWSVAEPGDSIELLVAREGLITPLEVKAGARADWLVQSP